MLGQHTKHGNTLKYDILGTTQQIEDLPRNVPIMGYNDQRSPRLADGPSNPESKVELEILEAVRS